MEPETRFAGNLHFIGPLINEVVEPPDIAVVAAPVTDKRAEEDVVKIPLLIVNIFDTVSLLFKVVPPEFIVRLLNVVEVVPPMVLAVPVIVIVPLPALNVPPLLIQFPSIV